MCTIADAFCDLRDHDDMLFLCMINTGFTGLLRLGEMTVSDTLNLQDSCKVVSRSSLSRVNNEYKFLLPAHKADTTFEGNRVHIACIINAPDPQPFMKHLITSCDCLFPLHPQLWLCSNGTVPTRSWFLHRLSAYCPPRHRRAVNACGWCHHPCRGWRTQRADSRGWMLVLGHVREIHSKECHCATRTHTRPLTSLFARTLTFG